MDKNPDIIPAGEHSYDPNKQDIDPVAFALHRVQTLLGSRRK
jgi:hypothetical protein